MICFSSFKGTDLLRNMLANCFMPQRRDRGTMGRRQPPWLLQPLLKISYRRLSCTIPTNSYVDKENTAHNAPHRAAMNGQINTNDNN